MMNPPVTISNVKKVIPISDPKLIQLFLADLRTAGVTSVRHVYSTAKTSFTAIVDNA